MARITNGTTCSANYDEDRIIFYDQTQQTDKNKDNIPLGVVS